ncbi:MAG: O-antigen ligase domain-containing protein [Candidatus Omnitrophica bacterium]|nr:O-antigen ligase domain-containing protein [Candidatus Omnitrophota bacterium]
MDIATFKIISVIGSLGILGGGMVRLGLNFPKRLWFVSIALVSAINFSFFTGEITSRVAIPDVLFAVLFICLLMRGALIENASLSFAKIPLWIFGFFFLTLVLSYQAEAWDRSILLGESQFVTFMITSLFFFLSVYFVREDRDILFFLRAWAVSALIAVVVAGIDLGDIFQPVAQSAKSLYRDGFFGVQDLISGDLLSRPYLSEYGFRIMGSFRTIGQLAAYALTSFFAMYAASFYPGISTKECWGYRTLAACLMVCAILTTRSSVYPSLVLGGIAILFLHIKKIKIQYAMSGVVLIVLMGTATTLPVFRNTGLYQQLISRNLDQLIHFFHGNGFFADQIRIVESIFKTHLWFGIGYGRFLNSPYHEFIRGYEIHSTPFQLLAETGLFGISAYLVLIGYFLVTGIKLVRQAWNTPWRRFYLTLLIGYLCMQPSYWYNRHLRERTFWLFVALIYAGWKVTQQCHPSKIQKQEFEKVCP